MFKKILLVLVLIILILVGFVALQPSNFLVTRSTEINAPAAVVFAQVNDFHKWEAWSPWAKEDPNAKTTFEGPPSGEGAVFTWAGNSKVGEGRMTIVQSTPDKLVRIKLDFAKPMAGTSKADFTFEPDVDKTEVTWTMTGEHGFVQKAVCLVMNMDKMIGEKFEQGLASMKAIAEGEAKK